MISFQMQSQTAKTQFNQVRLLVLLIIFEKTKRLIMIKSSDKKFNNSYRILRVLQNKDLLVIDSDRSYYIFAQFYNDTNNIHPNLSAPKKSQNTQKMNTSNILYYQELIVIDGLNYLVFKMPDKDIVWANNIELEKLNQKPFVNLVVKQALINILDKLLWLGPDFIHRLLNNKNFLLVNGHLYFILMPRNYNKVLSLKRNEKHRSLSSDIAISNILKKQSNIVKEFCQIVWFIIRKTPFFAVNKSEVQDLASCLLLDLITKNINLETALQKLSTLQIKTIEKGHEVLKFIKKQNIRRRSTIDNSSILKPRKTILFNRNSLNSLSKRMKTQQVVRSQNQTIEQKQEKAIIYPRNMSVFMQKKKEQENIKILKRRNYSFQSDLQNAYKTPKKIKPQTITVFNQKKSACVSEKQKNQFNNWKRSNTQALQQKIQNQTRKALLKFQLSCSENKNVEDFKQKQEKLKTRLLQKVIKFKMQRFYKQVQTQQLITPTKNLPFSKIQNIQNFQFIRQRYNNTQQIIQLTESVFSQNKKQPKIDFEITQKHEQPQQEEQLFKKQQNRKSNPKQLQNKMDNYVNLKLKQKDFRYKKYEKESALLNCKQTQSQLQEIILQPKKKQQKNKQTVFKRNKILQANTFQQLQDIQTIEIQQQWIKQKTVRKRWIEQSSNFQPETLLSDKQRHIKVIEKLIDQYLTFINILGDITASAIKNKAKLVHIQWRKTVYFLYQRFYYQRIHFLDNLKNKSIKITRAHRHASQSQWNAWNNSSQRQNFLVQVQRQNSKLSETFKKFASKLLKEDNVDLSFMHFLKGWQKILHSKTQKHRLIISKYGAALIINQYDRFKESLLQSQDSLHFLQDCLYGLKIIAELEGLADKNKPLDLAEYKQYRKNEEQIDVQVEQLYELFYKQVERNLPN